MRFLRTSSYILLEPSSYSLPEPDLHNVRSNLTPGENTVPDRNYKWVVLSNTTLGMLAAAINSSILLISLPAVFRGIGLKPLEPSNINYLLWAIIGYMIATAVLVVAFGRLGDQFGRARMYNLGFAIFTSRRGAEPAARLRRFRRTYLIAVRIVQGVGGALIMANSTALLTDAFPRQQRGLALGINMVALIGGQFLGLVVGGVLADANWRLVFSINVPIGLLGTLWAYPQAARYADPRFAQDRLGRQSHLRPRAHPDPHGDHLRNPALRRPGDGMDEPVGADLVRTRHPVPGAFHLLGASGFRADDGLSPARRRRLRLWQSGQSRRRHRARRIAIHADHLAAGHLAAAARLFVRGDAFVVGVFMLPLTAGFLPAGPLAGHFSDRFGGVPFAVTGMVLGAASFILLIVLPADFSYGTFAALLFLNGLGSGLFVAPNSTQIMNAVPIVERGQASGMRATTSNAGQVLSIGLFFSLMLAGLAATLPQSMEAGLVAEHVPVGRRASGRQHAAGGKSLCRLPRL